MGKSAKHSHISKIGVMYVFLYDGGTPGGAKSSPEESEFSSEITLSSVK